MQHVVAFLLKTECWRVEKFNNLHLGINASFYYLRFILFVQLL